MARVTDLHISRRRVAQTRCKRGHAFTPENTRIYRGKRCCRECGRLHCRVAYAPKRKGVRGRSLRERIELFSIPEPNTGCWLWLGNVNKRSGYGTLGVGQRSRGEKCTVYAHRASYETYRGPIPERMHIDHLCRVRCCVNPDHLEVVIQAENNRRSRLARAA
jgi:hypothetical protein